MTRRHKLLISPPGTGRTAYARALRESEDVLRTTLRCEPDTRSIYELAQLDAPKLLSAPFRAPHHTVSDMGMRGDFKKGYRVRPGELSLAHGGVLFLDDAPEFRRAVLGYVGETLRAEEVVLHGVRGTKAILPAEFTLVLGANPCPCGYYGSTARECKCSADMRESYLGRLLDFRPHCDVITDLGKNTP
jgi:magnesium chelatase family protein